jgi:cellulose synthase/poly-beta-1,6-N-acetylglucosamine synthase-like glycosyltransferase
VVLGYTVFLFGLSRRRRRLPNPAPTSLFFVFMVPCYNEELVVGQTLERLLTSRVSGYEGLAVLVVDDGSDDATASIVASFDDARVWLFSRRLPEARKGKGEALNAAYRYLRDSDLLRGRDPSSVVVCVMDADGRLEANALYEVGPYFADPRAGAVQVGVRMYNAAENRLTRMQDFEFVTFTEIFQRGRQLVGSVGLGGNGQFARLTALLALGDAPWTDVLTEDLDLGIRFLIGGWSNNFCPTTHVNQQAVTSMRRLLRQRIRWFQGHLQCWARLPDIFRSDLRLRATVDLVQHLLSPALLLLLSIPMAAFYLTVIAGLVLAPHVLRVVLFTAHGLPILALYVLTFGLAPIYAYTYWSRTREIGFLKALGLAHLYIFYTYLWIPAGWCALVRMIFRRRGWAKTTRTTRAPAAMDTKRM